MKTVVVGAGGGGIASALLATLRNEKVTLIEAHQQLGGCASYFSRGPFHFDVGATTVSGLEPGQPLRQLFDLIGEAPNLNQVDPGIIFHLSDGKRIQYHQDFDSWVEELSRHFSGDHEGFWSLVRYVAHQGWNLLDVMKGPRDLSILYRHPLLSLNATELFVSTDLRLKQFGLTDPSLKELIDGILLISTQATAPRIPFLVGAMGLDYPAQTYHPVGGMRGLMSFFEQALMNKGVEIQRGHRISSLSDPLLESADRIIFNVTPWNLKELIPDEKEETKFAWGAFTVYFAVEMEEENPYHQIHLNHPLINNYFASFSTDEASAPKGWQTVTISTHVEAEEWFDLDQAAYKEKKKEIEEVIIQDFKRRFRPKNLKLLSSGTPKTFQRYTHRKFGLVGGLPLLYGSNPLGLRSFQTARKNIFQVGDCSFPGQGLAGVCAGALKLHRYLKNSN